MRGTQNQVFSTAKENISSIMETSIKATSVLETNTALGSTTVTVATITRGTGRKTCVTEKVSVVWKEGRSMMEAS